MTPEGALFLANRMAAHAQDPYTRERFTGISSDALALFGAAAMPEPREHQYPHDEGDLAACERTYQMAPLSVQSRMLPVLEKYRAHIAATRAGAVG